MAKISLEFNPETEARFLLSGQDVAPEQLTKSRLVQVLQVLVRWTQGANLRAKAAEAKLREMPNWQSKHHDMTRLYRSCLSALKTAEAEMKALEGRQSAYDAELARWREESEKQFDECNRQLNEKDDVIERLTEQLTAALTARNRYVELGMILSDSARAQVLAAQADITLAGLGLVFTKPKDEEKIEPTVF